MTAAAVKTEAVREIALSQLEESKTNPRTVFDPAFIAELAESIKVRGIIEPLVVRPTGKPSDGGRHFEIIAGAQRYRAALQNDSRGVVPCIVRSDLDDVAVVSMQLVENLQRNNLTPVDEAGGYARLRSMGQSVEQIAGMVGKKARHVYARLQLTRLQTSAIEALGKGHMTAGHADLLVRVAPERHKELLEYLEDRRPTVKEFKEFLEREVVVALSAAPWKLDDAELVKKAGPCVGCKWNSHSEPDADKRKAPACGNRSCYSAKWQAYYERRAEQLQKEHQQQVVFLAAGWADDEQEGVLQCDRYQLVSGAKPGAEPCSGARLGLCVLATRYGGNTSLKPGDVRVVCVDRSCKKHWGGGSSAGGNQRSAAEKREQQKRRAETERKQRLLAAIPTKAPKSPARLSLEDVRHLAHALVIESHHDKHVAVCRVRGYEPPAGKRAGFAYGARLHEEIAKGDVAAVIAIAFQLATDGEYYRGDSRRYGLDALVKRWKLKPVEAPKANGKKPAARKVVD